MQHTDGTSRAAQALRVAVWVDVSTARHVGTVAAVRGDNEPQRGQHERGTTERDEYRDAHAGLRGMKPSARSRAAQCKGWARVGRKLVDPSRFEARVEVLLPRAAARVVGKEALHAGAIGQPPLDSVRCTTSTRRDLRYKLVPNIAMEFVNH